MSWEDEFGGRTGYGKPQRIPLEGLCRDRFRHLPVEKLLRKALVDEIALPILRTENSHMAARAVHLADLAACLDKHGERALKEWRQ